MLTDLIARIRPAGSTSADLAAAMERARAAQAEADAAVAAAQQTWEAALLDADLKELKRLEEKLDDAKREAGAVAARVAAVLGQLEQRHAVAKRAEVLGREEAARQAAEDAGRALAAWWTKAKPKLEAILQEGARLDDSYSDAQYAQQSADRAAREAYPDVAQQQPAYTGSDAAFWRDSLPGMAELPRPPLPERVPTAEELEQRADLERRRAEGQAEYERRNHGNVSRHREGVTVLRG